LKINERLKQVPWLIVSAAQLFLIEFILLSGFRLVFYLALKTPDVSLQPGETILRAFRMGLEFDMVATTYALLLPVFLLVLHQLLHKKTRFFNRAGFMITVTILILYAFISCADLPYFKQFGSHLNKQAFLWNASPAFVLQLIFGSFSYYGYLFLFMLLGYFLYRAVKKVFDVNLEKVDEQDARWGRVVISLVLLAPFMVAGARGRLSGKSTTHEGLAIVGDNLFVNQVALNPNFTLFRSLLFQKVRNYSVPGDIRNSFKVARKFLHATTADPLSIDRYQEAEGEFNAFNVVIVCMESMSSYKTGIHQREVLTPQFNAIVKQSVYFDRFFSSGIHTFNGIFSATAGFPCMPTEHALRRYTRQPFTTLGNQLGARNYRTCFFSTHDPHFDNMSGFLTLNGYKETYSAFDLPKNKSISVTGVPDHEIFDLFIDKINVGPKQQPFLAFIMTGSDHGPWVIPDNIPFKPGADTEEKRATEYADWALGELVRKAKKQDWFQNTLFVFVGDHGYSIGGTYEMPLSYHHVPFVLYKPGTLAPDTLHNLGYQPDITATVAGVLNLPFMNNTFGSDILKEGHPFVYFTADDKIGCISDDGYYYFELISQKTKRLKKYLSLDQADYYESERQKADSLEVATKSMLDAAEYLIRKKYFTY
jgi:phosphoglycerol transferase MdoB-like AlkP superfamily enzyme